MKTIKEAQEYLKQQYGETGHRRIVTKMRSKTTDTKVLATIGLDKNMPADIRIAAIASMIE